MRALCRCDEIVDGKARAFSLDGDSIIAVRQNTSFYTYLNRCPHLGIPLEWQPDDFIDSDTDLIRCATHGALFELDSGRCVSGPCLGQHLKEIPSKVENGTIYLTKN